MRFFFLFLLILFSFNLVSAFVDNSSMINVTDYSLRTCLGINVQPVSLDYNGSDFFVTDSFGLGIWEVNSSFCNTSDIHDVFGAGSSSPRQMDTNGSEYWLYDTSDDLFYKFDSSFQSVLGVIVVVLFCLLQIQMSVVLLIVLAKKMKLDIMVV